MSFSVEEFFVQVLFLNLIQIIYIVHDEKRFSAKSVFLYQTKVFVQKYHVEEHQGTRNSK